MLNFRRIFFFFLAAISSCSLFSKLNVDSLENLLKAAPDTQKVRLLNQIANELTEGGAYDNARRKLQLADQLLTKINDPELLIATNTKKGLIDYYEDKYEDALVHFNYSLSVSRDHELKFYEGQSFYHIGNVFYFENEFEKAASNFKKSVDAFEVSKNKLQGAESLDMLGTAYYASNDYEAALDAFLKALKVKQELKQEKAYAKSYNFLGIIYQSKKDYARAIENYKASLKWAELFGQNYAAGTALNNLGMAYTLSGDLDKGNYYNMRGWEVKEKDNPNSVEIINSFENIGAYYLGKENYDSAMIFFAKGLVLSKKLSDKNKEAAALNSIAIVLSKQGKTGAATDSLIRAKNIAEQTGDLSVQKSVYEELANCYMTLNDFKKAFEFQKKYSEISDSLINETNTRSMNELNVRFDSEKKELEITKKNLELTENTSQIKAQRIILFSVLFGLLIVLILSVFLFRSFRVTKKAKETIEVQKKVVEQKNEEITDSIVYAKRIQNAILPDQDEIATLIPDHFIIYKPKDIVSGDFYWMNDFTNYFFFAVADCTGHGVPGSLMSMIGVNLLNQITAANHVCEPNEILTELDYQLKKSLHQSGQKAETTRDGMEVALIKYNKQTGILQFSGAMRPLVIVSEGNMTEIKPTKKAIGGDSNMELCQYENNKIELKKNDVFYIYSDGFADQFGGPEGRKKMTTKRLKSLLFEVASKPIHEQKKLIEKYFDNWKGNTEQIDDVLLMGVRVKTKSISFSVSGK